MSPHNWDFVVVVVVMVDIPIMFVIFAMWSFYV
jgi:hypothetical protein